MSELRFHRLAASEFREVRAWYAERDVRVAERFVEAVNRAVDRILEDPESHPSELKEYRWVRVRRFPFRLIFERLSSGKILILAVAHTSRMPQYWTKRSRG